MSEPGVKVKHSTADVHIKSEAGGQVTAILAELDKIDHDGDLYTRETFTPGETLAISPYNHSSMYGTAIPVGKGTLHVEQSHIWVEAQFFMDNESAREAFTVVKAMGGAQEWSWGYKVHSAEPTTINGRRVNLLKKVQVYEASPVIRGASIGSRTLTAKEQAAALATQQFLRFVRGQLPAGRSTSSREAEARKLAMQARARYERDRYDSGRAAS
jgi:hypothetical protein